MSEQITFEAFGVALRVDVESEPGNHRDLRGLVGAVRSVLPPGARSSSAAEPAAELRLTARPDGCSVRGADGADHEHATDLDALHGLDREIRAVVSLVAPGLVFIHAGVVAVDAGAVVLPGRSFTGKTTLVAQLVEDGAVYLSDEYAVLDGTGAVWPYPRPLSFRTAKGRCDVPPDTIGTVAANHARPVAAVVSAPYQDGAVWAPVEGTSAACALALLDNAVAAAVQPASVLATVSKTARSARYLRGDRGEARPASRAILRDLASTEHRSPEQAGLSGRDVRWRTSRPWHGTSIGARAAMSSPGPPPTPEGSTT